MGVMIQEAAGAADTTPRRHRRHGLAALGLLTVASLGLSILGIGTGEGPLGPTGPRGSYGVSAGRDVGDDLTEGGTVLTNHGWFTVHVESIHPLPVDDAAKGLTITDVQLAPASDLVGFLDGTGEEFVGREVRRPTAGYSILPHHRVDGGASQAEVLVHARITRPGTWTYRGYEITYRSGLARHHMVVDAELQVCTPAGRDCSNDTAP